MHELDQAIPNTTSLFIELVGLCMSLAQVIFNTTSLFIELASLCMSNDAPVTLQ